MFKNSVVNPLRDFDWDLYEAYNGGSLKVNPSIKTQNGDKVYSHEYYAQKAYKKYLGGSTKFEDGVKDLEAGRIIKIQDVQLIGKDDLLVSTSTGNAAIINLAKENKFFDMFGSTKSDFKTKVFGTPEGRAAFVSNNYYAQVLPNGKASLYNGFLYSTQQEFLQQIELGSKANKAYKAHIISANKGGYICDVQGIQCFLPGSQATSNKITNFESLVGTDTEVMIMKYIEGTGFLVSRKKYLQRIAPAKMKELKEVWKANPNKIWTGTVTGTKHFGVFIELNEYYTGLLHNTYATETTLKNLAEGNIHPDDQMQVMIYDITDDNRIVLTDMLDVEARKPIIAQREKEEKEREEAEAKAAAEAKELAEKEKIKKAKQDGDASFIGKSVSFEDLKK